MKGRVLIIAGSDSGGGAGIQADIKTVTALGGYAATAITAITVQDTLAVHRVEPVAPDVIREQIDVVLRDIGADVVKIGMLGSALAGAAIFESLAAYPDVPVVLDPVLVATSGGALGDAAVTDFLRAVIAARAVILTPNVPEAAALTGGDVQSVEALWAAADQLMAMGARGVLAKAGHLADDPVTDVYFDGAVRYAFRHPRLTTRHTHGTGCTLASALATGIAQGLSAPRSAERAVAYVAAAIAHAPGLGQGHGPLNHALRETAFGVFRPV